MYFFGMGWNNDAKNNALSIVEGNLLTNPGFDSDTGWTKGAWTISGGKANATLVDGFISQAVNIVAGHTYRVTMTVTRTAGSVFYGVPDGDASGTARSTDATFVQQFVANTTDAAQTDFGFYGDGFSGTLDDVILEDIT